MVLSVKVKDDPPQESLTCTCAMTGGSHHKLPGYTEILYLVQYLSEGKEALEVFTEFVILLIETSYQLSPRIERGAAQRSALMVRLCSGLDSSPAGCWRHSES